MRILLFCCFAVALLRMKGAGRLTRPLWRAIAGAGIDRLDRLGPLPVKAAQILSTRADLIEAPLLARLARYRSGEARSRRGPGPGGSDAIGVGCIATVYARKGAEAGTIAVKSFRPEAVRTLGRQLAQCRRLCRLAAKIGTIGADQLRVAEEIFRQVARQADAGNEAANHRLFAANFAGQALVRVPALLREGADHIAMELIDGVDPGATAAAAERAYYGRLLLRCLYQMIFTDGLIHADLHPGNFLVEPDGTLVLLDFGLCWAIEETSRRQFAAFFLAFAGADGPACAQVAIAMAARVGPRFDEAAFTRDVQALLDGAAAQVGGFSVASFAYGMFRVQDRHGIVSTTDFLTPIMALISLEGTLRRLAPQLDFKAEARTFVLNCLAGVQKRRASDNISRPKIRPARPCPDARP